MARKTALSSTTPLSEMNMTPMMDLTFILLITFIITFPLIEQGIPVNLPPARGAPIEHDRSHTITIDAKGLVYLDDATTPTDALRDELRRLHDLNPDLAILIRADEDIRYRNVMDVMKILFAENISRLSLVTQSEDGSASP